MPRHTRPHPQPGKDAEHQPRQEEEGNEVDQKQKAIRIEQRKGRGIEPFDADTVDVQPPKNRMNPVPLPGVQPVQHARNSVGQSVVIGRPIERAAEKCQQGQD